MKLAGKICLGLGAVFSAAAAYALKDEAFTQEQATAMSFEYAETYFQANNIDCAPLDSPEKFASLSDQEAAINISNDLKRTATGQALYETVERGIYQMATLCFIDDLKRQDAESTSGVYRSHGTIVVFDEILYSNFTISIRRSELESMSLTLGHELAHHDKSVSVNSLERYFIPDETEQMMGYTGEAYARAISVQIAYEMPDDIRDRYLVNNYENCKAIDDCSHYLFSTYLDALKDTDSEHAFERTMIAWLRPVNLNTYTRSYRVDPRNYMSTEVAENNCLRDKDDIPDFRNVENTQRHFIARYMREPDKDFYDSLEREEIIWANTFVDGLLKGLAELESCETQDITSNVILAPAQP